MKKHSRLLVFILVLLIALSLSACTSDTPEQDGGTSNPPVGGGSDTSGFAEGSKITIVFSEEEGARDTSSLYGTLLAKIQTLLLYGDVYYDAVYAQESSSPVKNEIIVGNSNRDITKLAYDKLARVEIAKEEEDEFLLGYGRWVVYAKDGSVAIAYDYDEFLAAA